MLKKDIIDSLSALEILILTVIGEARGEPIEGQVAVACICRNRLHSNPGRYKTFKDVCLEPKQFSCWNDNDPNKGFLADLASKMLSGVKIQDPYLRQCALVAEGVYDWTIRDNTNLALFYTETSILPNVKWAVKRTNEHVFGHHTFFNI